MLSEECFGSLMRRYGPSALELMLCNYGEPLMNPNTPKFIALARSYLMRTGLSTNMTSPRFDARAYVASGLDFMTVSLDGASQTTYERYRRNGDLEQAFANIRALVGAKRDLGKQTPVISWQFLAFEHNAHEIEDGIAIARELGIDQFVVANPFDVGWDEPSIRPAAGIEPRTVHFSGNPESRMTANFNPAPDRLAEREIDAEWEAGFGTASAGAQYTSAHSCQWLYRNMVLDATGRVLPCCAAPKPGFDLVFDTFTAAGADSFNSPKYQAARQWFQDPARYQTPSGGDPWCTRCDWNQDTAHTDGAQVDQYFKTIPHSLFTSETRRLLSWD